MRGRSESAATAISYGMALVEIGGWIETGSGKALKPLSNGGTGGILVVYAALD